MSASASKRRRPRRFRSTCSFVDALADSLSDDVVVAAAIAHLWFVTIHPYEDGNGRMSRALADLVLARSFPGVTPYMSMTRQISRERDSYYVALERAQRGSLDITAWVVRFADRFDIVDGSRLQQ